MNLVVTDQDAADARADRYCEKSTQTNQNGRGYRTYYTCTFRNCRTAHGRVFTNQVLKIFQDHVDVKHFGEFRFLRYGKICDMCDHFEPLPAVSPIISSSQLSSLLIAGGQQNIKKHQENIHTERVTKDGKSVPKCEKCFSSWPKSLDIHISEECPVTQVPSKFECRVWDQGKRRYIYEATSNPHHFIAPPLDGEGFIFASESVVSSNGHGSEEPSDLSEEDSSGEPDTLPAELAAYLRLADLRQQLKEAKSHGRPQQNTTHIHNLEVAIKQLEKATRPSSRRGSSSSSSSKSLSKFSPTLTARKRLVYGF
ncbi:hypothetical protein JCM5350_001817 [Sporobolomyces pararoseus]